MADIKCPCGKDLHYTSVDDQRLVEKYVRELGLEVKVVNGSKTYMVNRHYIALHGLKSLEMEDLAKKGVIKEVKGN